MKVARKHTYLLEDRFAAEEKGIKVDIRRHRNTVIVDVKIGAAEYHHECSLLEFARMLRGVKEPEAMK